VENFTVEVSATVAYLNLHAATVAYPATIDYQRYLSVTNPRPQSTKKKRHNRTTYSEC
jgi:hypothetical protein